MVRICIGRLSVKVWKGCKRLPGEETAAYYSLYMQNGKQGPDKIKSRLNIMRTETKTQSTVGKINLLFLQLIAQGRSDCFPLYDQAFQRYMVALMKKTRELLLNVNESLNAVCERRGETALNYLLGMEKLQRYISVIFKMIRSIYFSLL